MTDNYADMIASGIAGLQVAATGQEIPEHGLSFDPSQSRLNGEMKIRVMPLNGAGPLDLTVIASPETSLKDAVQAGLDAAASPSGPSGGPAQNPGLN